MRKVVGCVHGWCVSFFGHGVIACMVMLSFCGQVRAAEQPHQMPPLPQDEIHRFVSMMALIHHCYIHKVTDQQLFQYAISGMVSNLDPHSAFLTEKEFKALSQSVDGNFVGVGIEVSPTEEGLKVISPLQGSPAEKAGIQPNDIVIKVDNTVIQGMDVQKAIDTIKGPKGTTVTLTVVRGQSLKTFKVQRQVIALQMVKEQVLAQHYGYIQLAFFQGDLKNEVLRALKTLKKQAKGPLRGLILDVRNNPGGLLDASAEVADLFLDRSKLKGAYKNRIVYTKGRLDESSIVFKAHGKDVLKGLPMVVLINGGSASASEIVAGALQDYHRAVILGTRSFGKGSVQTLLPLEGGQGAIKLTTALYYTPSGRAIQAQGIQPDVWVPNLKVASQGEAQPEIFEGQLSHHLLNGAGASIEQPSKERQLTQQQASLALATQDYQLYEALAMLKGMHAMRMRRG